MLAVTTSMGATPVTIHFFLRRLTVSVSIRKGAFHFSQACLPLLLKAANMDAKYPPTLIFTGATASLRGGANLAAFASGKFAKRALSQSLGREFGPKGVHVAHAVIDGVIDIPATKAWMQDAGPDAKINPNAVGPQHAACSQKEISQYSNETNTSLQIADTYWHLHTQPKSAFTYEIDIRPSVEKW